jgi:pimeloyl-ACP methyl ester carboxylesterase
MYELKHHTVPANGIRQHYVEAGDGPAVVLLHGFPFTNYTWRHQIPELAKQYRVIAPDLRGYGETDKPVGGYDKRNMANDLRGLMRTLGLEKISLVGHDRGARVATRFAKDHPEAIDRLVVLDNVPTRIIARDFNFTTMAKTYWLFLFHLKLDLPEILIIGREEQWLRHLYSEWCYNPHAISGKDFETYVTAYRSPGAVRGCLADYRASAEDLAQDLSDASVKISCPTLSIWGADFDGVGKSFNMPDVWAEMADNLRTFAVPECGHVPQEEQPALTTELLLDFLADWIG